MSKKLSIKAVILILFVALAVICGAVYLATEPKQGGAPSGPDFSKGSGQPKAPPGHITKKDAKK